jgi:tetraacyldisaccharide 4'-kinase
MNRARMVLWPASLLYGLGARVRVWAYLRGWFSQRRLAKPVVCVGNLTTGGTGKTPMVIWIAERFAQQGQRVGILTRGYKGARVRGSGERGGVEVSEIRSDEARLLECRLPQEFVRVAVGADRFASGSKLDAWADYFVLDDGLQHLQLARDVNIVLIDALEPFGGGQLLPAGNLREPKTALRRADVVVITRSSHSPAIEAVVRRYSQSPIFYATVKMEAPQLYPRTTARGTGSPTAGGRKFFAFCGIGNPQGFIADLRGAEIPVAGHLFFRDHHRYSAPDMRHLEKAASAAGADALLCTEKDLFNLDDLALPATPLWFCAMEFELNDPARCWETIQQILAQNRGGSGQP